MKSNDFALNGQELVEILEGFEVAPGDADDLRVCGAYPWQSRYLITNDGFSCGTTMALKPEDIGVSDEFHGFDVNYNQC